MRELTTFPASLVAPRYRVRQVASGVSPNTEPVIPEVREIHGRTFAHRTLRQEFRGDGSQEDSVAKVSRGQEQTRQRARPQDGKPILRKANREYSAIRLGAPDDWILWGTVTTVVEAPVELRKQ